PRARERGELAREGGPRRQEGRIPRLAQNPHRHRPAEAGITARRCAPQARDGALSDLSLERVATSGKLRHGDRVSHGGSAIRSTISTRGPASITIEELPLVFEPWSPEPTRGRDDPRMHPSVPPPRRLGRER